MKGFLNEPFVDRIFGFSTNSATKLDLDLERRLIEIFFESNKSTIVQYVLWYIVDQCFIFLGKVR